MEIKQEFQNEDGTLDENQLFDDLDQYIEENDTIHAVINEFTKRLDQ